jgi:hypothetical protein
MKKTRTNKRRNKRRSKRRTQKKLLKGGVEENDYFHKWFVENVIERPYKILSWKELSSNINPRAIEYLEKNPEKIDWVKLSFNPSAIRLLEANQDKIDWSELSLNPNAIDLLEANKDKIDWDYLSYNPNAIRLLEEKIQTDPDIVNWDYLSLNPNAISLLEANPEKINWSYLSKNENAIPMLRENMDKIDYLYLSQNKNIDSLYETNPEIFQILEEENMLHLEEDDRSLFEFISMNPGAMKILKDHPDKISWYMLSYNTNPEVISIMKANPKKIDLDTLAINENAYDILLTNYYNIDWNLMRSNPSIGKLFVELSNETFFINYEIEYIFLSSPDEFLSNPGIFTPHDVKAIRNFHKTLVTSTENATKEKEKVYQRTKVGQVLKNPDLTKEIVGFL